jgi:hypothetical protein
MAVSRKYFDQAIGESEGNGGDIQKLGNDLALVYGNENQVYLALFGGNVEGNTPAVLSTTYAGDYWANNLLWKNNPGRQFNSNTERVLNTQPLSSKGRLLIQNAVNDDLKYLIALGAAVTVTVTLPGINTVKIEIRTIYKDGTRRLTIITFGKTTSQGDFSVLDFNENFY